MSTNSIHEMRHAIRRLGRWEPFRQNNNENDESKQYKPRLILGCGHKNNIIFCMFRTYAKPEPERKRLLRISSGRILLCLPLPSLPHDYSAYCSGWFWVISFRPSAAEQQQQHLGPAERLASECVSRRVSTMNKNALSTATAYGRGKAFVRTGVRWMRWCWRASGKLNALQQAEPSLQWLRKKFMHIWSVLFFN